MSNSIIILLNDGSTVEGELHKDGNAWCVLVGPDLQVGVAGFGKTIASALDNFKFNAGI
jgi:hypothetical protein